MKLINCKNCGALFQKKLRDICDKCLAEDNMNIERIDRYVRNCSDEFISFEMINKATKVNIDEIEELYKHGRLAVLTGRLITTCKICGIEIKGLQCKNNFCSKCMSDMLNEEGKKTTNSYISQESKKVEKIKQPNKINSSEQKKKFGFKKSYD